MASSIGSSFLDHFAALRDPRQSWKVVYPLPEVLSMVLAGTIAGAEDFVEIRRWAKLHIDFLRRFLPFANGVPSHDTLNDIMNAIDGELFGTCFTQWVSSLGRSAENSDTGPEVVALDGKTSRRTHDRAQDRSPLHLVSAWASSQRLVLGHVGEVGQPGAARLMGLAEDDVLLGPMDSAPGADAALKGAADAIPEFGMAPDDLREDRDRAQAGRGLQHGHHLGLEHVGERIRAPAAAGRGTHGGQARVFGDPVPGRLAHRRLGGRDDHGVGLTVLHEEPHLVIGHVVAERGDLPS